VRFGIEFCSQDKGSGEWSDGTGTYWKHFDSDKDLEEEVTVLMDRLEKAEARRANRLRGFCRTEFLTDHEYAVHGYAAQKNRADSRGVKWEFTFEEWLEFWGDDLRRRGRGYGGLSMARVLDKGPYAPWNVFKADSVENSCGEAMYPKKLDLVLD
jgi:hypothetical protein